MDERDLSRGAISPRDYWHIGPVYIRKWLFLLLLAALSLGVLAAFGLPTGLLQKPDGLPAAYAWDDPRLKEVSGLARLLDSQGRVRYEGEVERGTCTGAGKVYDEAGQLVYDGPLVDGVYEGPDAKVYRDGVLVYSGGMAGNLYEGQGHRVSLESRVVSEGLFSRGFLEGSGREYAADGTLLREGDFSRDLLEGEGREFSREGVLLREGDFSAGVLHGSGTEYAADGATRYEGQFRRGVYHGQGRLYETRWNTLFYEGSFVDGTPMGTGALYHPSGQLLYAGHVYEGWPRADAFLGLSLSEVEEAFATHWLLYVCDGMTAFVYPDFQLMFLTESPVELVSPARQAGQAKEERRELLDALEGREQAETVPAGGAGRSAAAQFASGNVDEALSPDTDKSAIRVTQILSYGRELPGVAQSGADVISGRHAAGWREWFCEYAEGAIPQGASVRQSGQFVFRFTPYSSESGGYVDEFLAWDAGVETMTVLRRDKDRTLWYQTGRWKEEP